MKGELIMAEEKKNILTYEGLKKLEDELSDLSYFTFLLSIQGSCREKFFYWKDHRYQTMDELGQYCFDTFTAASSSGSAVKSRKKEKI